MLIGLQLWEYSPVWQPPSALTAEPPVNSVRFTGAGSWLLAQTAISAMTKN